MNYKQFEKYILSIKMSLDTQEECMNIVDIDLFEKTSNIIIEQFIQLIEEQLDDPFEMVSWFVFETKFGTERTTVIDENGSEYHIDSIEAVWSFLNEEKIKGE